MKLIRKISKGSRFNQIYLPRDVEGLGAGDVVEIKLVKKAVEAEAKETMAKEISNPKGTRDFLGEEKITRDKIVDTLKQTFESFGYSPLETPILERYDVLASKYTGGAEILKETFKLKDQGKRDLGLRYDLTVPLARVIAMNPNLKLPFKRYEIGLVFRDGPVQLGRYRVFMQCDADVIGSKDMAGDAEIIALASIALKKLGFDAAIKVNNRKILDGIVEYAGVKKEKAEDVVLSIDKLEKFGLEAVKKELKEKKIEETAITKIMELLDIKGNNEEKLEALKKFLNDNEGLREIEQVLAYTNALGIGIDFDISLARGLAYYTGTVFEAVLKNSKITSSVAGGGRYDRMIGALLGKGDYPAVGISFGLDRLYDAYVEKNKVEAKTVAEIFVIPINTLKESLQIAQKLRDEGLKVDMDLMQRGVSKNLDYANSMGIPYVIFIGPKELQENKVKLRDMKSGEEKMMNVGEVAKEFKIF